MKRTLLLLLLITTTLFSCTKETLTESTTPTNFAKIISSVTSWHVNNNYNRRLTIQYNVDTNKFKSILVLEDRQELFIDDFKNTAGTVSFFDHYSCQCNTYYTIMFVDANGNRTHIATELTKP